MTELLAVIGIFAVLSTLGCTLCRSVMAKVALTSEVAAAKNLIHSYIAYTADHDGQLLEGVANYPTDVLDKNGKVISKVVSKRWVPRLAAYFNYDYPGTVVVNEMKKTYSQNIGKAPILSLPAETYIASAFPSLGLNGTFVGGNYKTPVDGTNSYPNEPTVNDAREYGSFYVSTMAQVFKPHSLIVFASAQYKDTTGDAAYGNEYIYAPHTTGGLRWSSSFDKKAPSGTFGHVHPRWEGKAVVAMLDGSVKMFDQDELKDMRHWSNQAAEEDDPHWHMVEVERDRD